MLTLGMRVRFLPQPEFWHDPNGYEPPVGTTGTVTLTPMCNGCSAR